MAKTGWIRVAVTAGYGGLLWASNLNAETPADFLARFRELAVKEDSAFSDFDPSRGERFFRDKHGDWSCASCHTDDPRKEGRHARTDKSIAPLAPVANAKRFTEPKKVEKWLKRNCNDVLGRACTAREKGDVLSYLLSLKS